MTLTWSKFLFQVNYAGVILFLGIITFVLTNRFFSKKLSVLFIIATCLSFLLLISDNIRHYTASLSSPGFFRYFSAAFGYTARPFIVYVLAIIAGRYYMKNSKIFVIPAIVNGLIAFLSCIFKNQYFMFYFTEINTFQRGIFGFLPYIISMYYVVMVMIFSFKISTVNIIETISIVIFVVFSAIATYLESVRKFDLVLSQTILITIIFYYLFLNIQLYRRDSLTQLLKRRSFYFDLNHFSKKNFVLLSMDMNDLKYYNDTFGHNAGDEALKSVVLAMQKTFKRNAVLYRTGGDEFMAIFRKYSKEMVESSVLEFQKNLKKIDKEVACGISVYNPGDSIENLIAVADKAMYKNKKLLKSKK